MFRSVTVQIRGGDSRILQSPTTDHDAGILSAEDPYLSYDAEKFPYQ
jgi:hypothetical protein